MTIIGLRNSATLVALAILATAMTVPDAGAGVQKSFERTFKVNGAVEIDAKTGSEDLKVRTGDNGIVIVRCTVKSQNDHASDGDEIEKLAQLLESHLPVHQEGNHISIEHRDMLHTNVVYEILVPLDTRLTYDSQSGDLAVEGIRGPVEFKSASGDIHLSSVRESVHVYTSSGDVDLDKVGEGGIEVDTQSGDVKVNLTPEGGYDLLGHTVSGDFSIAPEFTLEPGDMKNEVRGKIRGGGAPVNIRTGSGDVRIN